VIMVKIKTKINRNLKLIIYFITFAN